MAKNPQKHYGSKTFDWKTSFFEIAVFLNLFLKCQIANYLVDCLVNENAATVAPYFMMSGLFTEGAPNMTVISDN